MKAFYLKGSVTKDLTRSFEDIIKESENNPESFTPETMEMGITLESIDIPEHLVDKFKEHFQDTKSPMKEEEILEFLEKTNKMNKVKIYLDDVRTPVDPTWKVVRNYEQFVDQVTYYGLENIEVISLDHDLGPSAMAEWHSNVYHNYKLNYDNITEKTGMDCTKWLVEQWLDGSPVVDVVVHSANAVGASNIMGYINNYRHIHRLPQNCVRVRIEHTV